MLPPSFNKNDPAYGGDIMHLIDVIIHLDFQSDRLANAIIRLHEKSYTEDFVFSGEDFFWVQEKIFIKATDCSIVKVAQLNNVLKENNALLILAVTANGGNIKGIVMHYYNYGSQIPGVLTAKPGKLKSNSYNQVLHD